MAKTTRLIALIAALLFTNCASAIGASNPPRYGNALSYPHLPALGQESAWSSDYGIVSGRCNASMIGAVVTGAEGSDGGDRLVATLHGPILSDTPAIDAIDRGCMGHALELAPSFFAVRWTNPETQRSFILTPMRRLTLHGNQCRVFSAEAVLDGDAYVQRATACRHGHGEWYLI